MDLNPRLKCVGVCVPMCVYIQLKMLALSPSIPPEERYDLPFWKINTFKETWSLEKNPKLYGQETPVFRSPSHTHTHSLFSPPPFSLPLHLPRVKGSVPHPTGQVSLLRRAVSLARDKGGGGLPGTVSETQPCSIFPQMLTAAAPLPVPEDHLKTEFSEWKLKGPPLGG